MAVWETDFVTSVFLKRGAASDLLQDEAWPPACPLGKAPTLGSGCCFCVGLGREKGREIIADCFCGALLQGMLWEQ